MKFQRAYGLLRYISLAQIKEKKFTLRNPTLFVSYYSLFIDVTGGCFVDRDLDL